MSANITVRRGKGVEMAAVEGVKVWWEGMNGLKPNRMTPAEARQLEVVRVRAGMDWDVGRVPAQYTIPGEGLRDWPERHILYRKDNGLPLGEVSNRYKIHQPRQILGFFNDILKLGNARMETAGTLHGGRKFWAMARIADAADALCKGDEVRAYLLATTSVDGSGPTTVTETTTCVVCSNTLQMALNGKGERIRIPHSTEFSADVMKQVQDRLATTAKTFGAFMSAGKALAKIRVTEEAAARFVEDLLRERKVIAAEDPAKSKGYVKILELFNGGQMGADLKSRKGTAWGLVNAVTEWVDHNEKRTGSAAVETAWFGWGDALKSAALGKALELV